MNGADRAVTTEEPRFGPIAWWNRMGVAALLVLSGMGAPLWTTVSADAKTMQQKLDIACSTDGARLCPENRADPDDLKACLLKRRPQVSEPCMRLIDASE